MKIELLTIIKWLSANKLSFNADKTKFMIFDASDDIEKIVVEVNGVEFTIKECKTTKYLGLMVDNKLNFKSHIDYIKKKVMKRIGAMYLTTYKAARYIYMCVAILLTPRHAL
jgi:hypothetical protein